LYEDDRLAIETTGARKIPGNSAYPSLMQRASILHTTTPNHAGRFPVVDDMSALWRDARRAAEHMFQYMDRFGWTSDWFFQIRLREQIEPWSVDLANRTVVAGEIPPRRKRLTCFTDASYFGALIRTFSHWNNAIISYNLEWERVPNEYDPLLYKAINFFHIPKSPREN
jgi:hypothetical protein